MLKIIGKLICKIIGHEYPLDDTRGFHEARLDGAVCKHCRETWHEPSMA